MRLSAASRALSACAPTFPPDLSSANCSALSSAWSLRFSPCSLSSAFFALSPSPPRSMPFPLLIDTDETGTTRSGRAPPAGAAVVRSAERGQAEVVAQRRPLVVGTENAALLQQRDDAFDERVEPAGGDVRDEDVAVGGFVLHQVVDGGRHRGRAADERLPRLSLDHQLADRVALRLGQVAPLL